MTPNRTGPRPAPRTTTVLASALAIAAAVGLASDAGMPSAVAATAAPLQAPANGEMGFVVTQFHVAPYIGDPKTDCPDGMMGVLKDSYLRTLTTPERTRLSQKENAEELQKKWQAYADGPNNGNICSNVYEFLDRPPTPMNKGKVGIGLNLDGDNSGKGDSYTCQHDNFTSPAGEQGIDNQYWRVGGCSDLWRGTDESGNGEFRKAFDGLMMTGQMTQVILLRGVNSLVNDPDVEIVYANTDDRPIVDSHGTPVFRASYSVSILGRKARYRNVLHGRIVNGVLTTDAKDIHVTGTEDQFDFDRARIRLEFQPDGTAKVLLGGYSPLLSILYSARRGGRGATNIGGIDCAGQYAALRRMADGDKDPKTGQCRKISYAYELFAVPAFVNDAQPSQMATK
jgi:hypothetical protein